LHQEKIFYFVLNVRVIKVLPFFLVGSPIPFPVAVENPHLPADYQDDKEVPCDEVASNN